MATKKAAAPPRVEFRYERCSITLVGVEMNCPLCGQLVPAGTHHEGERNGGITVRRNKPTHSGGRGPR